MVDITPRSKLVITGKGYYVRWYDLKTRYIGSPTCMKAKLDANVPVSILYHKCQWGQAYSSSYDSELFL